MSDSFSHNSSMDSFSTLENRLNSVPDWVWEVDSKGNYVYSNNSVEKILGYTPDEIAGQSVFDVLQGNSQDFSLDEASSCVCNACSKDGRDVKLAATVQPVVDHKNDVVGFRGVCRDITKDFAAQCQAMEAKENYKVLIDNALTGILIIQEEEIVFTNSHAQEMTGRSIKELTGRSIWQNVHPDDKRKARDHYNRVLSGKSPTNRYELRVYTENDGWRHFELRSALITYDGAPALLVNMIDITDRKRSHEQSKKLHEQFESHKKQFYRETILSVTDGKLAVCDTTDIRPYVKASSLSAEVEAPESVGDARAQVAHFLQQSGMSGERLEAFMIGVGEALTNAIAHGRRGKIFAGVDGESVWVGVADVGKGIDSLMIPKATLMRGFSTMPSMGLGYTIMLDVSDRILLKTTRRGTTVVLVKTISSKDNEEEVQSALGPWQDIWTEKN